MLIVMFMFMLLCWLLCHAVTCSGASVWRQVSETCGNMSRVDLRTFTIAVQVGS